MLYLFASFYTQHHLNFTNFFNHNH